MLLQSDFFAKMVLTEACLKQALAMAFVGVESLRVIGSPATLKPGNSRMVTLAEALLQRVKRAALPIQHRVRDEDLKYANGRDA